MSFRKTALAAAAAVLAATGSATIGSAQAGGPNAHRIDLGSVNGVAYFTEEAGRFHVVATLAQQEGQPVRFEAVLAPGQSFVVSTAREGGTALTSVEISRQANDLVVQALPVSN